MNNIGREAAAVLIGPNPTIVVCPTAEYKAPNYICYDYVCQRCPRGDQGNHLVYLPQHSEDPHRHSPAPRVYTRWYHDFRYQVYAVNQYEMPPQQSRARLCFFWCHHEIDTAPEIQRTWYYVPWGRPIRGVLQDDGNEAFTNPVTGHTVIYPPPRGFIIHPEANGPMGDSSEAASSSVESYDSETSIATPGLEFDSSRSRPRSFQSDGFPPTPRSSYNIPGTYRLPTELQTTPFEAITRAEIEERRREGAILVEELGDNERTPTRENFGGEGGQAALNLRGIPGGLARGRGNGRGNGNINPPHGPRGAGNGRGQNRGRGGRPTRIWNWNN